MTEDTGLLEMTADIVSAYVTNNSVSAAELPGLISAIHASLSGIHTLGEPEAETIDKPTAAQIRKSVSDKGIISFLDGKTYQSLKRHLTTWGMTPDEYRAQYGLPSNYPMVAPAYAARRSELAKSMGLGQGGRKPKGAASPARPARKARAKA